MQRDFVVQIRPDSDLQQGQFQGRVEHVDSGRSGQFRSLDEFLALVVRFTVPDPETANVL